MRMMLQMFGGRGASSSLLSSRSSYFKNSNVEGTPSNAANAKKLLQGVSDVLSDFGMRDAIPTITYNDGKTFNRGESNANVNGFNQLSINNNYLANDKKHRNSKDYFANDSFHGTGTHEAGHVVVNKLLRDKVIPDASNLQKANARSNHSLEKAIIKEAKKRYGLNPPISKYGSTNVGEKIAEAISDVYSNRSKSNPYSKVIVSVMKDINVGSFKPKIRLSNRV